MTADLILYNGLFHTLDSRQPVVEAVAIANRRIVAIGDSDAVKNSAGRKTTLIDLEGRCGLPGMTDSHFHFHEWSFMRNQVNLADVVSFAECMEKLRLAAMDKPAGEWVLGQGFNESDWPENRLPQKQDLDGISKEHPLVIWRCDLHMAVANSLALELCGIDRNTPDPPEGVIERDANGQLTGVLKELAINLVKKSILPIMETSILQAMKDGMRELNSLGLTGVHDVRLMGGLEGADAFKAWQKLDEAAELSLRSWVTIPGEDTDEAIKLGLRSGFGNDSLRLGHLKFFGDGGMGARTAHMLDPYLDGGCGMPLISMEELEDTISKADRNGLAVMVHAIGDHTNRELIRLFEKVLSREGNRLSHPQLPHRIEHLQMIRPQDIQKLAGLDRVIGCVQPHNLILDINMIEQAVGDKGEYTYPYQKMLEAGVELIFSSDAPVASPSPLVGIHAAVARQREDGTPEGGWYPQHKVSVEDAVRAYTLVPAIAGGAGNALGSLTPGKLADLVILDRDIFTTPPETICKTKVLLTVFDGRIVYRSENW
jgi:predicted amidohydrolase YtcJ